MRKVFRKSTVLIVGGAALVATMAVAGATASSGKKLANVQVCVLLPDTKSSVRWVDFDAPDFKQAFQAA